MKHFDGKLTAAYIVMILLWGSAFVGIRVGLTAFSPEHLSILRLIVGSFALLLYASIKKIPLPDKKDIPLLLLLGFFGFSVYQTALNIGEKSVTAGTASLLVSATPIFSSIFAFLFQKRRQNRLTWIGSFVAFFGVFLISLGNGEGIDYTSGALWILIASVSESFYFLFQEPLLKKYGFLPFTAYSIWGATLWMLFYLPGLTSEIVHTNFPAAVSVVLLGIFPTVLAYLAFSYVINQTNASEATLSLYLTPIAAFLFAWAFLGEVPESLTVIGGFITFFGLFITHLKWNNKKKEEASKQAAS